MLSIIIVTYNAWEMLRQCLNRVHEGCAGIPYEVIVIDNASDKDLHMAIKSEFPWVEIQRNIENKGFAAANNQAMALAKGDMILLLNPDTEVEPGSLAELVRFLLQMDDVGIVGPKIYFPDGTLQFSCGRFPNLLTEIVENYALQRLFPRHPITGYYLYRNWDHATLREVDWVTGACLLIRREVIDQIGLMDESYFMYSEEIDWCYRAKEVGWKVYYLPQSVIVHHEGGCSNDIPPQQRLEKILYRQYILSTRLFFRKFYGPLAEGTLRFILIVSHVMRLFVRVLSKGSSEDESRLNSIPLFKQVLRDLSMHVQNFQGNLISQRNESAEICHHEHPIPH